MSWDVYFMSVAILSSFRSKDPKTQNGACIVNKDKRIIGVGYNGLPTGLDDDNTQFWNDSDDSDIVNSKHSYVVHAEANAIYNRNEVKGKNSTLYVTFFPCRECAKAILQNNIKKVVYLNRKEHHTEINRTVETMFENAGIEHINFNNLELKDRKFIDDLLKLQKTNY